MLNFLLETTGANGGNPAGGGLTTVIMLVLLVGMFWFMSRSNKKKEKEAAQMRDSLQVGDEVTTIGGIIGKVVSIKEETFVLETTKEKTQIRFLKGAIRSVDVRIADIAAAAAAEANAPAVKEDAPKKDAPKEEKKKISLFGKKKTEDKDAK